MAVNITIEFTDEQWALVEEHFPNYDADGQFVAITAEQLQTNLFRDIKREIEIVVAGKAEIAANVTF